MKKKDIDFLDNSIIAIIEDYETMIYYLKEIADDESAALIESMDHEKPHFQKDKYIEFYKLRTNLQKIDSLHKLSKKYRHSIDDLFNANIFKIREGEVDK